MNLKETLKYMEAHLFEGLEDDIKRAKQNLGKTKGLNVTEADIVNYLINNYDKYKTEEGQKALSEKFKNYKVKGNYKSAEAVAKAKASQAGADLRAADNNLQNARKANEENLAAESARGNGGYDSTLAQTTQAVSQSEKNLQNAQSNFDNANQNLNNIQNSLAQVDELFKNLKVPKLQTSQNISKFQNEIATQDNLTELAGLIEKDIDALTNSVYEFWKSPAVNEVMKTDKATQEILNKIKVDSENDKATAKKSSGFFSKLGQGLLKGANALAGIAGNFIGGIASGMGGAR